MSDLTYLVTTGTRGDVAPFIAFAKQLQAHGNAVIILSNTDHIELAKHHGIALEGIAKPDPPQTNRDDNDFFATHIMPGYEAVHTRISRDICAGFRPKIISRTGNWGGQFVAEAFQLPFQRIALQPCAIRKKGHPISTRDFPILNEWRHQIGLPPLTFTGVIQERTDNTLCLFPHWFGSPESTWAEAGICTDFAFLDDESFLPDPELLAFLSQYGPPIVFSAGTGIYDSTAFIEAGIEVARQLDIPVIHLGKIGGSREITDGIKFIARDFVDHGYLIPKTRLVVHNGGIGVIGQAVRAQKRQVIVPLRYDQPDNAARLERLGLGKMIPLDRNTSRRLFDLVNEIENLKLHHEYFSNIRQPATLQAPRGDYNHCTQINFNLEQ